MAWAHVDNSDEQIAPKVEIRRHVLDALTPERAQVFDAFAGAGVMWANVWRDAASYVGCDERWHDDARRCYVADNRRVLRCIDLAPFNCFDLDAYASAWEQVIIILARRPPLIEGERLGLVVTDGGWPAFRTGKIVHALQTLSGVPQVRPLGRTKAQTSTEARRATAKTRVERFDDLITRALQNTARRMRGRIVREWRATSPTGVYVRYAGVIIEGHPAPVQGGSTR